MNGITAVNLGKVKHQDSLITW